MNKKLFLSALLSFFVFLTVGSAESLPAEGPAPCSPVVSAFSEDNLSYDDGSLSVLIHPDEYINSENKATKVYYIYVKITDPSQLRTATAGAPKSAKTDTAAVMAQRNNAVLAINGDFYNGNNRGVAIRQGEIIRNKPHKERDALIIDENADLHILPSMTAADLEAFRAMHEVREAFCFGPGLIIDGVRAEFNYREKISCGYPTRAQRMIFCQTGEMEYLFFAAEGPEQGQPGMSVPECVALLENLGTVHQAYNLDGGSSTSVVMNGLKINAAESGLRSIGDIIYFATLVNP